MASVTSSLHLCPPQYELRLVASDNLNENYTKVVVHVRDVNDNPPQFDKPIYQAQITEEDDRGLPKQILKVRTWSGVNVDANVSTWCLYKSGHFEHQLYRILHCTLEIT